MYRCIYRNTKTPSSDTQMSKSEHEDSLIGYPDVQSEHEDNNARFRYDKENTCNTFRLIFQRTAKHAEHNQSASNDQADIHADPDNTLCKIFLTYPCTPESITVLQFFKFRNHQTPYANLSPKQAAFKIEET